MNVDDVLRCLDNLSTPLPMDLLDRRMDALRDAIASMNGEPTPVRHATLRNALLDRLKALKVRNAGDFIAAVLPKLKATGQELRGKKLTPDDVAASELALPGAVVLANLVETLDRYVYLPLQAAVALALVIVLAYAHQATSVLPIVTLSSPTRRCGKSTLLMLASALLPRVVLAANITPASVFRTIEKYAPTLLLDEADTAFAQSDELRTVFQTRVTRARRRGSFAPWATTMSRAGSACGARSGSRSSVRSPRRS